MAAKNDETLLFVVEYFDPLPQLKRQYLYKYFVADHAAEMVDVKSKKLFLKKSPCPPEMLKEELVIGGKILFYSRELDIVDYGDGKTRDRLQHQMQPTMIVLPPDCYKSWGKIVDAFTSKLTLLKAKTVILNSSSSNALMQILDENSRQASKLQGGVCLTIQVGGPDGFSIASSTAESLMAKHGEFFYTRNGMASSSAHDLLFDPQQQDTSTLDNCTCCIVKPHSMKRKQLGEILDIIISQGYEVSALKSMFFEKIQAEEFLEVYKGVVPEFQDQVVQLCSGMCVAMEIRAQDAVTTFRETAGPWDAEMAKELRPDTIRGRFGENRVRSAVHCTDLADDGVSECEYCFKLL